VSAPNLYQTSFLAFLQGCVWTVDEARAGEVRRWPTGPGWDDYWADWDQALFTCSPLLIDKTRRTMASNTVCAFDLWLAAGGTDRRWPILLGSQSHRLILIQAKKLEDKVGSAEFVDRIALMYRHAVEHGIRDRWPGFPTAVFTSGKAHFSNGSHIEAVPQGADQIRGPGATLIHMEELGVMEQAEGSVSAAIPALSGVGHLIAVTTPNAASYAKRIRDEELGGDHPAYFEPTRTLPLRHTKDDWFVLEVRGERDVPGYDPKIVGKGMGRSVFRREVQGDWTATTGKLVYEEYGDFHRSLKPIDFDVRRPLVLGWDLPAGTGGTPACVVTQLNTLGQWLILSCLIPRDEENIGVYAFGEWVAQHLHDEFAAPNGVTWQALKLIHYGDPAGNQKPSETQGTKNAGLEARSAFEILRSGERVPLGHTERGQPIYQEKPGFGWVIQPGEVSLTRRIAAVRARLGLVLPEGLPGLVVCPTAKLIDEGFAGGYHFHQRSDGTFEHDPMKNRWSHGMDALSYVASRLFAAKERKPKAEGPPVTRHRPPGRRRE